MLFSVVTITFNAEKYLAETLASVKRQTFTDFEHLVFDGGSTDNTLKIVKEFPHVTLYQGKDTGISDAMNKGAERARGEFLLFLHADDLFARDDILELLANTLRLHPATEWLYGRACIIDEKGIPMRVTPYEPFSVRRLLKYNFLTHPSTMISKKLFCQVGGFNTHLRYAMDYDLWLRCAKVSTPLALSSCLSHFREHLGSLSTREFLKVTDEAYLVRNLYVNLFQRIRSYRTWKKRRKRRR